MTELHPITRRVQEYVAEDKGDPPIFDVKAPIKLSAMNSDGRYRMIDLKDEEFFLKSIRPGKRSEWIIELSPISAAAYTHVELLDKDMANIMPELEGHLSTILGYPGVKFRSAAKKFIAAETERVEAETMAVETRKYDSNPNWGSF